MNFSYDIAVSYRDNFDQGPRLESPPELPYPAPVEFLGQRVNSRIGIAAGLLPNFKWISGYAARGWDLLTYKTVRSVQRECYPVPNWVLVDADAGEGPVYATDNLPDDPSAISSAVCFGMPSMDPSFWREDIARAKESLAEGQKLIVSVVASPEADWSADAQADADILWGTAEQSMTAFLLTYPAFDHEEVEPIYIRPAVIAVKAGNPKGIEGFEDLLGEDISIVVTEGAGVYNTSGTGTWEDVAGRLGRLDDIAAFRENIVAYALGSGASFQQFQDQDADAWITWPNWPLTHQDVLEMVELDDARKIWRDVNVVISPDADAAAQDFLDFLVTDEAQDLMATEGWQM